MGILQSATGIKGFQEVLVVLDTEAMDKEIVGATLVDRLLMLQFLFEDELCFSVGVSNRGLFLTKAEVLMEMYPKGTGITFIVGYDTLARVFDPKYYEDREEALARLFTSCTFMVANRGDYGRKAFDQLMTSKENVRFKGKVQFCEIPKHLAQISSSQVRQRVREGGPFARLVPAGVREFIEKVKLYTADTEIRPRGQRVNLYEVRTQILRRLYALSPEGRVEIDIGEIVDTVVEGVRAGQRLEALLDCLPQYIPRGEGKGLGIVQERDGVENKL
jgi:nicotinic acid mononucleotide adenylyltransferase